MTRIIPHRRGHARVERGAVLDARSQADVLIAEARLEAEALRARAHAEATEEAQAAVAAQWVVIDRERTAMQADVQAQAKALGVDIAKRIVGDIAQNDAQLVERSAAAAFARFSSTSQTTLHVHEHDVDHAMQWLSARGINARVQVDASVARGGCIVQSALGRVDARLDVQLAAFARALGVEP